MKSQVLHTTWCHISGEAAGEIWTWSLLGVKGLRHAKTAKIRCGYYKGEERRCAGTTLFKTQNVNLYTLFKTEDPENSTQSGGTSLS